MPAADWLAIHCAVFRAPMTLDGANRAATTAIGGLAVAGAIASLVYASSAGASIGSRASPLVIVFVMAWAWAWSPRELVVDEDEIRVMRRAATARRFPISSVTAASPIEPIGPGVVRVFGVGGFFGSYGLFWSRPLGRFHAYATRRGPAMIVHLRDRLPVVLTPDDVPGAIAAIERAKAR